MDDINIGATATTLEEEFKSKVPLYKEHIKNKEDMEALAEYMDCSTSSIYNYFAGKKVNVHILKALIEQCDRIVASKLSQN